MLRKSLYLLFARNPIIFRTVIGIGRNEYQHGLGITRENILRSHVDVEPRLWEEVKEEGIFEYSAPIDGNISEEVNEECSCEDSTTSRRKVADI